MFDLTQKIELEYNKEQSETTLRGWKFGKNGFILVDAVSSETIPEELTKGTEMIARYTSHGTLGSFLTHFVSFLPDAKLWAFDLKEELIEHPLRSNPRIHCLIPAIIKKGIEGKELKIGDGMVCDLSIGGLKILTKAPIPSNDSVKVSFHLGTAGLVENEELKLVRTNELKENFEFAGPFTDLKKGNRERLNKFFDFCNEWTPP